MRRSVSFPCVHKTDHGSRCRTVAFALPWGLVVHETLATSTETCVVACFAVGKSGASSKRVCLKKTHGLVLQASSSFRWFSRESGHRMLPRLYRC